MLAAVAVAMLTSAAACDAAGDGLGASGFAGESSDAVDSPESDDGSSASTNASTPSTTDDPSGADPSTDPTDGLSSATAPGDATEGDASTSGDEADSGAAGETGDTDTDTDTDTDGEIPALPSPGCGVTDLSPGTLLGVPLEVGNRTRVFNVVVPDGHDGDTPVPVVLAFHGWSLNPVTMATMSSLSTTAQEHDFVVAYAQGVGNSWNAGSCCGVAFNQQVDDIEFVRALIDNIGENLCVDLARVYATGFSNGGMLSHRLACEASDVIAAIAPVAGVVMIEGPDCTPTRPMPIMHFHGTADTSVAYEGNGMVDHVSVPTSTAGWVDRNGCDPEPQITFAQDDTTCQTWSNCGGQDAVVTLCSIEGMGHCWPGDPMCIGGNGDGGSSTTLPAGEAMATFFAGYAVP